MKSKYIYQETQLQCEKAKNNVQVLQDIRSTFKNIFDIQLKISEQDNIFLKYAGEVERNQMLREELEKNNLLLQTKDQEIDKLLEEIGIIKSTLMSSTQ